MRNRTRFPFTLKLLTVLCLLSTAGCASIPFIGGRDRERECEYREVYSVAIVEKVSEGKVHFRISGYRSVARPLEELPTRFAFNEGARFQVRQDFLTRGSNCDRYRLTVLDTL